MEQELWKYEGAIRELEGLGCDVSTVLWNLLAIQQNGLPSDKVTELVRCATAKNSLMPSLNLPQLERALNREQKILWSYKEREAFPYLKGGRRNQVAIYADIAKTEGKETAIRWAIRAGLSPRSIFRLKSLINSHK